MQLLPSNFSSAAGSAAPRRFDCLGPLKGANSRFTHYSPTPSSSSPGFTLLEVILAVAIATGILIAMLLFYRQAADLRGQLLQETERLASIRLILDRITADLRTASSDYESLEGLTGDTASLQFVKLELPPVTAWAKTETRLPLPAQSDLRIVTYSTRSALEGTNLVVAGLVRAERPMAPPRALAETPPKTARADAEAKPRAEPEPITDVVRFIRFRYWDGTQWLDSWDDVVLPQGVEVSLGTEAMPEKGGVDEYFTEVFRRVIYLPGHGWSSGTFSFLDEETMPEVTP